MFKHIQKLSLRETYF